MSCCRANGTASTDETQRIVRKIERACKRKGEIGILHARDPLGSHLAVRPYWRKQLGETCCCFRPRRLAALAAMNPAQYKKAMQQRALERRAELERAEALPQRSLGATHPPRRDSSFAPGGQRGASPKVQVQMQVQVHGDDSEGNSEGGSAATSFASAAAGGGSVEGFSDQDQVRGEIAQRVRVQVQYVEVSGGSTTAESFADKMYVQQSGRYSP